MAIKSSSALISKLMNSNRISKVFTRLDKQISLQMCITPKNSELLKVKSVVDEKKHENFILYGKLKGNKLWHLRWCVMQASFERSRMYIKERLSVEHSLKECIVIRLK